MRTCDIVISESGVEFGTSGARGLVISFTPEVCAAFVTSFLFSCEFDLKERVLVLGRDNRPSSEHILQCCAAAAAQLGYRVENHGVLPTPALAYYAIQSELPCIMVTGSHIPHDRNGLKFYTPSGEITKKDEESITKSTVVVPAVVPRRFSKNNAAVSNYIARYATFFGSGLMDNFKVGIYEHSSAGRDIYASLFVKLGAEVVSLQRTDTFVPIDTEAVSTEDQRKAEKWTREYDLDCIFSTDGDGDRPMVADENGHWIKGDVLCLIASIALGIQNVVYPVSCNTMIESSGQFKKCVQTKIGSPYVISGMDDLRGCSDTVAGFEANGGYLLGSSLHSDHGEILMALPTRDALLPFLALISISRLRNKPISHLTKMNINRFTQASRLENINRELSIQEIAKICSDTRPLADYLGVGKVFKVNQVDGLRMFFDNGDVVHYRPSGNAPELRCYVESYSDDRAKSLLDGALSFIGEKL